MKYEVSLFQSNAGGMLLWMIIINRFAYQASNIIISLLCITGYIIMNSCNIYTGVTFLSEMDELIIPGCWGVRCLDWWATSTNYDITVLQEALHVKAVLVYASFNSIFVWDEG